MRAIAIHFFNFVGLFMHVNVPARKHTLRSTRMCTKRKLPMTYSYIILRAVAHKKRAYHVLRSE